MVALFLVLLMAYAPASASDKTDVLKAEAEINAAVRQHDVSSVGDLLTADYTLVLGSGKMYDRASFLKLAGDPSVVYSADDAHDQSVRFYGDSTAIVVGILDVRGTVGAQRFAYRLRYTDTWIKMHGAWLQAAGHSSTAPDD